MKVYVKMILMTILLSFVFSRADAKQLTIQLTSDDYPVEISIYRCENQFQKDLLDHIKLDSSYTYVKDISELDYYIIMCNKSNGFLPFFWDSNISIKLNAKSVFQSNVINSKCTDEYHIFVKKQNEKVFNKILKLDTLIRELEKSKKNTNQILLVESRLNRQELMSEGPKNQRLFIKSYLKENPTSFVVLFIMHIASMKLDEADKNILKNMPSELKENHRYIQLIDQ